MKKIIAIIVAITLITVIAGCASQLSITPDPEQIPADFETADIDMVSDFSQPQPEVKVMIEEYYGGADDALELIYEDGHYTYSLSSIRSEKIMLTFEDGQRISLKEAISQKKISIEDLILNGLQTWIYPKSNPLGGEFNYHPLGEWYLNKYKFAPSNRFMYIAIMPGSGDFIAYFAVDELVDIIETCGYKEEATRIHDIKLKQGIFTDIEGIEYITDSNIGLFGMKADIGWEISIVRAPVWFSFMDSPSS